MAQPTVYFPVYNFTLYQASHPSTPLPAASLDAELFNVASSIAEICENLALIQRDDGAIANQSVGIDQLKDEVSFGINAPTTWVTAHPYVARDAVYQGNAVYVCLVAHTSTVFATDLAAGYWQALVDFSTFLNAAAASAAAALASANTSTANATQTAADRVQTGLDVTNANAAAATAQAAAAGIKYKASARASTTGALPNAPTYANGTAGVGATLTAGANAALAAQDGVTLLVGDRLLVQNQATTLQNGVYAVTAVGSGAAPWVLTRVTDFDQWTEIFSAAVPIDEGTTLADTIWICTSNSGGTVGVTAIVFNNFSASIPAGGITTSKIANNAVTNALLAQFAAAGIKGALAAGAVVDLTPAQVLALILAAPLASPALTGTPTAPTAALNTNSTQLATTAYADRTPVTTVAANGVTITRAANTIYRNTTGKTMFVQAFINVSSGAPQATWLSDSAATPSRATGTWLGNTNTALLSLLTPVLNNDYYELSLASGLTLGGWLEWQ